MPLDVIEIFISCSIIFTAIYYVTYSSSITYMTDSVRL
jgi:hypothetical protein